MCIEVLDGVRIGVRVAYILVHPSTTVRFVLANERIGLLFASVMC